MTLVCGDNYAVENLEAMIGSWALEKTASGQTGSIRRRTLLSKPAVMGWLRARCALSAE